MRVIIGNARTPANPLLRAIYLIVGAIAVVVALVFGAVLFAFILGIVVILGIVAAARIWWINRRIAKAAGRGGSGSAYTREAAAPRRERAGSRIIEGEYTEVSESSDRDRHSGDQ
jgi:hypothetical protein